MSTERRCDRCGSRTTLEGNIRLLPHDWLAISYYERPFIENSIPSTTERDLCRACKGEFWTFIQRRVAHGSAPQGEETK